MAERRSKICVPSRPAILVSRVRKARSRAASRIPRGVAVDNDPASPDYGNVYVADTNNKRVQELEADGKFVLMFGEDVDQTTGGDVCTAASADACKAGVEGTAAGQFGSIGRVTVDPQTGNVYVQDYKNYACRRVHRRRPVRVDVRQGSQRNHQRRHLYRMRRVTRARPACGARRAALNTARSTSNRVTGTCSRWAAPKTCCMSVTNTGCRSSTPTGMEGRNLAHVDLGGTSKQRDGARGRAKPATYISPMGSASLTK